MTEKLIGQVQMELNRQLGLWGEQNHLDGTGGYDEVLEQARLDCRQALIYKCLNWKHILAEEVAEVFNETSPENLKEELIQVIAVATAWIECIERRNA